MVTCYAVLVAKLEFTRSPLSVIAASLSEPHNQETMQIRARIATRTRNNILFIL